MRAHSVLSSVTVSRTTPHHGYPRDSLRFLVKVTMPVEAGNQAAKAGTLGTTIQSILADVKPEAVSFVDDHGQRTALLFIDMQDASQIPAMVEPWLLAFQASSAVHPVMVPEDLAKASSAIEAAVKKYSCAHAHHRTHAVAAHGSRRPHLILPSSEEATEASQQGCWGHDMLSSQQHTGGSSASWTMRYALLSRRLLSAAKR